MKTPIALTVLYLSSFLSISSAKCAHKAAASTSCAYGDYRKISGSEKFEVCTTKGWENASEKKLGTSADNPIPCCEAFDNPNPWGGSFSTVHLKLSPNGEVVQGLCFKDGKGIRRLVLFFYQINGGSNDFVTYTYSPSPDTSFKTYTYAKNYGMPSMEWIKAVQIQCRRSDYSKLTIRYENKNIIKAVYDGSKTYTVEDWKDGVTEAPFDNHLPESATRTDASQPGLAFEPTSTYGFVGDPDDNRYIGFKASSNGEPGLVACDGPFKGGYAWFAIYLEH